VSVRFDVAHKSVASGKFRVERSQTREDAGLVIERD
jgi:hypothetical protein